MRPRGTIELVHRTSQNQERLARGENNLASARDEQGGRTDGMGTKPLPPNISLHI